MSETMINLMIVFVAVACAFDAAFLSRILMKQLTFTLATNSKFAAAKATLAGSVPSSSFAKATSSA